MTTRTIAILGALDTKGPEHLFLQRRIEERGFRTLLIDVGVLGEATAPAGVTREEVAEAAGVRLADLAERRDRGEAVAAMSRGAAALLPRLYAAGRFDGVIALGGSGGASVACAAMRALPLGLPKVMVSTVAGGDVSGYVGVQDIVMIPAIVDVAGLNRISRRVFAQAAGAICGMVEARIPEGESRPLIAASMFGNTTQAVDRAMGVLEESGYEVLVFHCTGAGGRTMEALIDSGQVEGVLDITTTEWADELVGGIFSAGPTRLEAAGRRGVPAVVAPGCLDMVNFGAPETVPARFEGRLFYRHNPNVTLMRTSSDENRELGEILAGKLNASLGPVTVVLPTQGLSVIGAAGGPFRLPEADQALFESLKRHLQPRIAVVELDCTINDPLFAETCAQALLQHLAAQRR